MLFGSLAAIAAATLFSHDYASGGLHERAGNNAVSSVAENARSAALELEGDGSAHDVPLATSGGRYRAPEGFGGHRWGDKLSNFVGLEPEPHAASVAFSPGKVTFVDMQCVPSGAGGCDLEKSLRTLQQKVEARGYHAMTEYYAERQGFRFGRSGVTLYPSFWMFCARWENATGKVPDDILTRLKLCGSRLLFRGESHAELEVLGADAETTYEKVLDGLIALYGRPDNYRPRERITVRTGDGQHVSSLRQLPDDNEWRWCGALSGELASRCSSSVVLAFDRNAGWGTVVFVTRPVWEFAFARHQGGAPNNSLYQLLHGLNRNHPVDERCTGTHLCRPDPPRPMSQATHSRFRLPSQLQE